MTLEELVEVAVAHWTHPGSRIHGPDHWHRVATIGEELAAETPEADLAVIRAFAALHDCQRERDGRDPEHGRRAAALVLELDLGLTAKQVATLVAAISEHADGKTSTDATIGCCWDADRLDLPRVGARVSPQLLSTRAALDVTLAGPPAGARRFPRLKGKRPPTALEGCASRHRRDSSFVSQPLPTVE